MRSRGSIRGGADASRFHTPGLKPRVRMSSTTTLRVEEGSNVSNNNAGAAAGGGMPSAGPNSGKEPSGRRPWSPGRVIALIVGILLLAVSLGTGAAGGVLALTDKGLRDGQGYFMRDPQSLSSTGYAVASQRIALNLEGAGSFVADRVVGDLKVAVTPRGGAPVFVGIAPAADAARYLAGVEHSVVLEFPSRPGRVGDPVYRQQAGGPPDLAPGQANIWAARASGTGRQSMVWPVESGDWAVVVMNADGTRQVSADVAVGATFPGSGLVVGILLAVAAILLILAIILLVAALRTRTRHTAAPGAPGREAAEP